MSTKTIFKYQKNFPFDAQLDAWVTNLRRPVLTYYQTIVRRFIKYSFHGPMNESVEVHL